MSRITSIDFTNNIHITDTTNSTSADTGALIVKGGLSTGPLTTTGDITCNTLNFNNMTINGKVKKKIRSTAGNTDLGNDYILNVTALATVTLPDITDTAYDGVSYLIIKQTSSDVTVTTQTADKINSNGTEVDSVVLDGSIGEQLNLTSNGGVWHTLSTDNTVAGLSGGGGGGGGVVTYGIQQTGTKTLQASAIGFMTIPTTGMVYTDIGGRMTTTAGANPVFTCNTAGTYDFEFSFYQDGESFGSSNIATFGSNIAPKIYFKFIKTLSGNSPVADMNAPYMTTSVTVNVNLLSGNGGWLRLYNPSQCVLKEIITLAVGDSVRVARQHAVDTYNHKIIIKNI